MRQGGTVGHTLLESFGNSQENKQDCKTEHSQHSLHLLWWLRGDDSSVLTKDSVTKAHLWQGEENEPVDERLDTPLYWITCESIYSINFSSTFY